MKTREIEAGKAYSNGKGTVRLVTELGDFRAYPQQADTDCVRYTTVDGRGAGTKKFCTRNSFAAWAKERAPDHDEE